MRKITASVLVYCAFIVAGAGLGSRCAWGAAPAFQNVAQNLDQGWRFRQITSTPQEGNDGWMPATVPGDVHLDLLANKKIPDPFYRDNEAKVQWVENASWEYSLTFTPSADLLNRGNIELVFDGLDAMAEIYLNDTKVLDANNPFRTWRVAAKNLLHSGANKLRVVFPSPIQAAAKVAADDPWQSKVRIEPKTYIRKAAYEFGWDWGPHLVTSGIWREVRLEAWDSLRISDFAVRQRDVSKDAAHLDAQVEIQASAPGSATVQIHYEDSDKPSSLTRTVAVHPGINLIEFPIEIRRPKLWYPAGYGEQPLYEFVAQVGTTDTVSDEHTVKVGLRSVELRREPDKWGRSFEFVVNGIPVFAKGADVIPFDSFPDRVTTAKYRHILESARDANMNMIRDWGGGYYESDEFYQICDELGIMVWQDFMFSNYRQPGTTSFKQNMEAEAEDQVRRLRNHPSIVLWSGNNEIEWGLSTGNKDSFSTESRLQMWQDYLTEFSGILNRVVARLDAETPYWPSSPSADYEPISDAFHSGDDHIWDVWHGGVPFSTYETHHSRFVSEYGFQSFPEMRTVDAFTDPDDRTSIFTPVMLAHQKNGEGNSLIHDYMLKYYAEPKDFASFLYLSQVLQAEGIKVGAEYFRRSRPETMGSLFWQLNDCWPVVSWSSIDYYGRWKALQYYAKRFYAPVLVSPHIENGSVKVYIVSDKVVSQKAELRIRLMDFSGKVLRDENRLVDIAPLSSQVYAEWPLSKISGAKTLDASRVFVVAELKDGETQISRNLVYLLSTKQVHMIPATLRVETNGTEGKYKISVTSPVLARSVYLSFGDLEVDIADNYFDLLPGETREIDVKTGATLSDLKAQLKVISLTDAFAHGKEPAE